MVELVAKYSFVGRASKSSASTADKAKTLHEGRARNMAAGCIPLAPCRNEGLPAWKLKCERCSSLLVGSDGDFSPVRFNYQFCDVEPESWMGVIASLIDLTTHPRMENFGFQEELVSQNYAHFGQQKAVRPWVGVR